MLLSRLWAICASPALPHHLATQHRLWSRRARGREARAGLGEGRALRCAWQGRAGAELHSHPSDVHSLMRPYHQTLPEGSQHPFRGQLCLGCRFYLLSKTSCFLPKYCSFFPTRRGAFSSKLLSLPSHLIDALHNYHVFKNATLF